MSDDHIARPVSGEIMSGPAGERKSGAPRGDVHDAEFESLPRRETAQAFFPPRSATHASLETMTVLQQGAARTQPQRGGPLFWSFGTILVLAAFWISGGHALVMPAFRNILPPAATPAAAPAPSGLTIDGVASRLVRDGPRLVLTVDGEVANRTSEPRAVPALSIRVTDAEGTVVHYRLGTNDARLAPGGTFPFSGRLAAPQSGLGTVTVDFATRESR